MAAISRTSRHTLSKGRARECSRTAWAISVRSFANPPLLPSLAESAIRLRCHQAAANTQAQELAGSAWAVSPFGLKHPPLLDSIAAAAYVDARRWDSVLVQTLCGHSLGGGS